jgi:nucleoside-diphosphate-sugar epimerase
MDGQMRAVQTDEQQMKQTEPCVDAEHPPKKPPGRAMLSLFRSLVLVVFLFESVSTSPDTTVCVQEMKRVLVVLGNGRTGKSVVRLLHESNKHHPVSMVRDVKQKPAFDDVGVQSVLGDLHHPIDHLLKDIDVVIFCAGGTTLNEKGYEGTVQIDLAGATRSVSSSQASDTVSRFIMLSGTNVAFDTTSKITHWHRAKAYADTFLKDSAAFGRPLDWTIVCPAALRDDPLQQEDPLAVAHNQTQTGPGAVGNTSRDLVAAALVKVIDMPNAFGKSFLLLDEMVKEDRVAFAVDGASPKARPLSEALASL